MAAAEIQIGPLRLHASASWTFSTMENVVYGRHDSRIGGLQIALAFANDAGLGADHARSMAVLREFMEEPDACNEDGLQIAQPDALFGETTIRDSRTFRRYWYRLKNGKLLLALYQCDLVQLPRAGQASQQAAKIAATMELTPDTRE